jgi:small conductance mechanosensitive channel
VKAPRCRQWLFAVCAAIPLAVAGAPANDGSTDPAEAEAPAGSVHVSGAPEDSAIDTRIESILAATGWFDAIDVEVDAGVVALRGVADSAEHRDWANSLARNTEGVVAVVDELDVQEASPWDLAPAMAQIRDLAAAAFRSLPLLLVGVILLTLTAILARSVSRAATTVLQTRVRSELLRGVFARAVAAVVFVLGLYVVLRVAGLTGLAVTIVGGTGLLGLAIGFAFRDIAENFLASILISIQRPFAMDDLISVDGYEGYVRKVNTRATILLTRDGNHVQVPNAVVYKNPITNYTANPRGREDFLVGIGYDDAIPAAQSIALDVLKDHPAVLDDPEPLVLVEELGAATVNLRVLFWIDIARYSQYKVRSAVIRLTKSAFDSNGISMPDEAREVIFPQGVPLVRATTKTGHRHGAKAPEAARDTETARESEGGLGSDTDDLERQSANARLPEGGQNLIQD